MGDRFYQSDCVILYLRDKITVKKDGVFAYDLTDQRISTVTGDCSKDSRASIKLNYVDVPASGQTLDKVKLE